MKLRRGSPPPENILFQKEVIAYLEKWERKEQVHAATDSAAREPSRRRRKNSTHPQTDAVRDFFEIVGGGFAFDSDGLVVYIGDALPSIELRCHFVNRLAPVIVRLGFRTKLEPPSCSKWTKDGPNLAKLLCVLIAKMLYHISKRALGAVSVEMQKVTESSTLGEFDHIVEWRRVLGKTSVVYFDWVVDTEENVAVVLQLLIQENYRLLTIIYLKMGHGSKMGAVHRTKPCSSPVVTLADDKASPIYGVPSATFRHRCLAVSVRPG